MSDFRVEYFSKKFYFNHVVSMFSSIIIYFPLFFGGKTSSNGNLFSFEYEKFATSSWNVDFHPK
jgi:hypothetical protein